MRFLLLARARTTGAVRLLSSQAYASRTAAVDAATVTAHSIELGDDEVLAVDLDSAGPVLVLRIPATAPVVALPPESGAIPPVSVADPGAVAVPAASTEPIAEAEEAAPARPLLVDGDTILRLQPRFPLFGLDDDEVVDETLAETLRRVARRMERDLKGAMGVEWAPVDDTWDARTFGDYSVAEDTHDQGAHDEVGLRRDAAIGLLRDEEAPTSDAILARHDDDPLRSEEDHTRDESDIPHEAPAEGRSPSPFDDIGRASEASGLADATVVVVAAPDEIGGLDVPDLDAADHDAIYSELAVPARIARGLFAGDDDVPSDPEPEPEAAPDPVQDAEEADLLREADVTEGDLHCDARLGSVSDDAESPDIPIGPKTEGETAVGGGDRDTDPEPERSAEPASVARPEPEPYRALNVDFAIWVCADCVWQRTCRKAGVATPATCGNFQWKSF